MGFLFLTKGTHQYSHVPQDKPPMRQMSVFSNSFPGNQFTGFPDQVNMQEGSVVSRLVIQGGNLFGHDSGQCFDNGMNLENLPQNAVALDPTEEKILFGDDNKWDALGSGVAWGQKSAVAETASNDIGLQEEWSGLSSQNTEVAQASPSPKIIQPYQGDFRRKHPSLSPSPSRLVALSSKKIATVATLFFLSNVDDTAALLCFESQAQKLEKIDFPQIDWNSIEPITDKSSPYANFQTDQWIMLSVSDYPTDSLKKLARIREWQSLAFGNSKTPGDWNLRVSNSQRRTKFAFWRSIETISRHFNAVLQVVLRLHKMLLVSPEPLPTDYHDQRWSWFQEEMKKSIILFHMLRLLTALHLAFLWGNIRDILEHKKNLVNVILVFLSPGIPWTGFTTLQMNIEISLHAAVTSFVQELFHSASPIQVECMYAIKIAQNLKAPAVTPVLRKGSISPPMTFSACTRTTEIRRLLMAVTLILELVLIPPRFTLLFQSAFWK
ncbi:uncharacterized protein LOC130773690 [Actinidia eriantha]|uniref:uncharacterized protein LOC130773690 n=1 Tax=Actinidia eriantha TaxID=165200 RepID=UPI00258AE923|nr:uncharacterized protein LOC130773690 [Actinidia eriantha]